MSVSPELLSAYRFHRAWLMPAGKVRFPNGTNANDALRKARADMAAGRKRYTSSPWAKPFGAVSWSTEKPGLAFVQSLDGAGLRYVGRTSVDGRRGAFSSNTAEGWITDPYGDVAKDGTGLCWGVVYQLPARDGRARFVAGYIMGGCSDDLPTVDFGNVYEGESYWDGSPPDCDAARDAASAADSMAKAAAESEREYQAAWAAGSKWAELGDDIASSRREALALLAERRAARNAGLTSFPNICETIETAISDCLEFIADCRAKRAALADGDGGEHVSFWTGDKRLRAAFNEAAGRDVLPV